MARSKLTASLLNFTTVLLLCLIQGSLNPNPIGAQQFNPNATQSFENQDNIKGLRFQLVPAIGIGRVSGDVDGDVTTHYVRPGLALTGTLSVLVTSRRTQPHLGLGIITGISTTVGRRAMYKERIWVMGWEFRSVEGIHLQPKVYFAGPLLQFSMIGGQLRGQFGRIWNKSDWDTNLFQYVLEINNARFRDDQTGDGVILGLIFRSISLNLLFQELEGRIIWPKEGPPEGSIPVYTRTTWLTVGISF